MAGDTYLNQSGLDELVAKIQAAYGKSVAVSTTATTVSLSLKNGAGTNLGDAATFPAATTTAAGAMSADDKTKLNGVTAGAEPNQNAFANVKVGSTNIQADAKSDTIEFVAGSNVTLTPDATNDKVTIAATDTTYSDVVAGGASGLMTGADKTKLNGIATGAEVNQNAFANVKVGNTTVAADAKQDTLELVAGSNVTLTPDATNDKVIIAATDTTYSDATTSAAGLMSAADKTKLDGIEANATKSLKSRLYTAKCTTAASTAAKVVTLDDSTGFALAAGVMVAVQFQYGNSANTPTLNVNSTGAKNIAIPSGATTYNTSNGTTYNSWGAYETLIFTYDGSLWVHMGSGYLQYQAYKKANDAAPKASPAFTGTPTAPTAAVGTNTTQIATTAFVVAEVADAISDITGISFEVVATLPATGSTGVIYLVSNSGSGMNAYDEYIWLDTANRFEKIGTTDVDLSGYVTTTAMNTALAGKQDTMTAITTAYIDSLFA